MFKFYYVSFSSIKCILFLCPFHLLAYIYNSDFFVWLGNITVFIKYYFRSCLAHRVESIGTCSSVNISPSANVQNTRLLKGQNSFHQYQRMKGLYEVKCGNSELRCYAIQVRWQSLLTSTLYFPSLGHLISFGIFFYMDIF